MNVSPKAPFRLLMIVFLLAMTAVVASSAYAQAPKANAPQEKTAVATVEEHDAPVPPSSPDKVHVKVHGHWIIDVKDKDGKIVQHRDFQNSLTDYGKRSISQILAGTLEGSFFAIELRKSNANLSLGISPGSCLGSPVSCGRNLVIDTDHLAAGLTLTGSVTASQDIVMDAAVSMIVMGDTTKTPAQWYAEGGYIILDFTSAPLTPVLTVLAGQTVYVQVAISFS